MTGQELYERYTVLFAKRGVTFDRWDELPQKDCEAWDELAGELTWK